MNGERVTGPSYNLIPGNENMSLVSQDFYVLDIHTVKENIFDKLIGYTDEYKKKRAHTLLTLLELLPLKDFRAKDLSSGQKQRVAIARALSVMPQLLLLDEPFSNLDHLLTEKLFHFILREVKKNNTAVILITHIGEEALKYANRVAIMEHGRLTQTGPTWEVYYQPANSRLAGLLGDYNVIRQLDLERKRKTLPAKFIVRPDRIVACTTSDADLFLNTQQCLFNGKCFEVLMETKNQHTVLVYSSKELKVGKQYAFKVLA
jgi:ABC-type sulfate/molybdate transport systems ATPase subunit